MKKSANFQKGFTLIELLVVVAIIGLLASIIAVGLRGARVRAQDTKKLEEIKQIQIALEMYYDDNGHYPLYHCEAWWNCIENAWGGEAPVGDALKPYFPGGLPKKIEPTWMCYDACKGGSWDHTCNEPSGGYAFTEIFGSSAFQKLYTEDGGVLPGFYEVGPDRGIEGWLGD